jgi:hypothetical protein
MEFKMNDLFLMVAGAGGVLIAVAHGMIGHRKILTEIRGLPPVLLHINYAVFQMSTVYWLAGGIALLLAPFLLEPREHFVVAVIVAFLYIVGALGNGWITRGRHFGGYALALVASLALLGA